jgi:hypothetical protein
MLAAVTLPWVVANAGDRRHVAALTYATETSPDAPAGCRSRGPPQLDARRPNARRPAQPVFGTTIVGNRAAAALG